MRIGYFNLLDGHQFYSVWLFATVEKITDRNDPTYVVDKPQLRYVSELILECFRTYAVAFDTVRFHKEGFVDEAIVFRHGMAGIYSIENKSLVVDVVIPVVRGDFPLSTLDLSLTEGVVDPALFGRSYSFVDVQWHLYQFRHSLANHFM